jgi:hypothetical protein
MTMVAWVLYPLSVTALVKYTAIVCTYADVNSGML